MPPPVPAGVACRRYTRKRAGHRHQRRLRSVRQIDWYRASHSAPIRSRPYCRPSYCQSVRVGPQCLSCSTLALPRVATDQSSSRLRLGKHGRRYTDLRGSACSTSDLLVVSSFMSLVLQKTRALPSHSPVMSTVEIRQQFPALARVHDGHPVAYFDGPGGTQVPRSVVGAMEEYLYHHNANTHWQYPTSEETDALLLAARETFADFFNASADEIAFGQNMTTLTFHLARGLGRDWKAGDEIVVTELDHHGNVAPWRALAMERGVTVRTVKMNTGDGRLDWRDLERLLGPKTRLLAIGAASN